MGRRSMEHADYAQELRVRFDPWALGWRAGLLAMFGSICVLMGPRSLNMPVSLAGMAIALPPVSVAIRYVTYIVARRAAVVLTPEWIESNALSGNVAIMWQEIAAMFPYTQSRNHFIAIIPNDRENFLSRLSSWQRFWARLGSYLMPAPFNIWTSAFEVSPDVFWRQLVDYGRAHVPHFADGLDHEEPSRLGDDARMADEESSGVGKEHSAIPRRARPIKSRKQRRIEQVSMIGTAVLVMIVVFPLSLLLHQDHPNLDVPVLMATVAVAVIFGLAALPRTRMRSLLAWCAFVSVLSAMGFAIVDGWEGAGQDIYGLISLLFVVVVIIFTARFNRRLQRIFSRDPHER